MSDNYHNRFMYEDQGASAHDSEVDDRMEKVGAATKRNDVKSLIHTWQDQGPLCSARPERSIVSGCPISPG